MNQLNRRILKRLREDAIGKDDINSFESMEKTHNKIMRPLKDIYLFLRLWLLDFSLKRKGYICSFTSISSQFYLPYIRTDGIQLSIYGKKNYYEYELLNYICNKWGNGVIAGLLRSKVTLDIGANIGNHTLYFLNECKAKFVYCFEPAQDTFKILERNIIINKLEGRTYLRNAGVGNSMGFASISNSKPHNTAYTQIELSEKGSIEVVSIDGLNIRESIGFVKIDVEGFELAVINGMKETIKSNSPFIMIEIWKSNFDEIFSILEGFGYQYKLLEESSENVECLFFPSSNSN